MNILQKLLALFGRQYVLLVDHDGTFTVCHAYPMGSAVFARRYWVLSETACELLPGGGINGRSYVTAWRPLTSRTFELFDAPAPQKLRVTR